MPANFFNSRPHTNNHDSQNDTTRCKNSQSTHSSLITDLASFCARTGAELVWPTRCAVCDAPGYLLCPTCLAALPYIDQWRACPLCGGPFGLMQCTECNDVMLATLGRTALPFASCSSALVFNTMSRRIVTAYKDQGEQRLAANMASMMAPLIAPRLYHEHTHARETPTSTPTAPTTLCFIPASKKSMRKRGFDHAELLARSLAQITALPCAALLMRPHTHDQRALSRHERAENMSGAFAVYKGMRVPKRVLLIDDVCTTGATLMSASDALKAAGCKEVHCLTFARTW